MTTLQALPLPNPASFGDLVFRPHPDGLPDHFQALHLVPGGYLSVTKGGRNDGVPSAPYEMMTPDGVTRAPLTEKDISSLLPRLIPRP